MFEAAPEKMELKQAIFAEIERAAPVDAILTSNTSVMPITKIMAGIERKHRALGTHWWNPPHLIPLVEVIRTQWTDESFVYGMMELLAEAGKTPVRVDRDVPGFIGNRLQHALWREAISLVERGICDAASVDTVIKSCFGRRRAVLGPLENADLVGLDLTLDIHAQVLADLETRQEPSPLLEAMVDDRHVQPDRPRKSIGAEDTFPIDTFDLEAATRELVPLVQEVWRHCEAKGISGRTVTLKVTFPDFVQITRRRTIPRPFSSEFEMLQAAQLLLNDVFPQTKGIRLLGVSLSALDERTADVRFDQMLLFS